ncbi:MAG: hypothetical protein ACLU48_05785 [Clostridiaceae bacterium]
MRTCLAYSRAADCSSGPASARQSHRGGEGRCGETSMNTSATTTEITSGVEIPEASYRKTRPRADA